MVGCTQFEDSMLIDTHYVQPETTGDTWKDNTMTEWVADMFEFQDTDKTGMDWENTINV